MKALSIRQPWAWLIVQGYKDIENRSWPTDFRGRFLVHASKTIDSNGLAIVREAFEAEGIEIPESFQTGGIVGEAHVIDCVDGSHSPWFEGPFGFVLRQPRPLPFRPLRGQLGFFEVNTDA